MFAIIDTETTGGNPAKDRIMEIAIFIHDGEKVLDKLTTLVNPQVPIAPFIRSLTGINEDMLVGAPTFKEIAQQIAQLTDKTILVAHNAGFDYSVLRNEFRRVGMRFQRKQLCTVKLSRQILPGYSSYSLGKLCRDLEIKLEGRHRAYGDAAATVQLFDCLLKADKQGMIWSMAEAEYNDSGLVPNLSAETVEDLPEETGIYYLHDQNGKVLFLSKSRNIRRRVIDLLTQEFSKERYTDLRNKIFDISYEITGSELIAQLCEAEEMKKHRPAFNQAQRVKRYKYGVFQYPDESGFLNLKVDYLNNGQNPVIEFTTRRSATSVLKRIGQKYGLLPELCGLKEKNGSLDGLNKDEYNARLAKAFNKYRYRNPNFFIIGEGRSHHEQSVVWIEDHQYKGYGYFEPEYIENDLASFKEVVHSKENNPDNHRIIRAWLGKRNKDEIIAY
ncbi:MAG: exonuclease domain-containing protein [Chitinophagales bacterium]|nr:exonuclease domain-containing protein [Chitinophagales bacterium]